jgi:hypothetical protein
MLPKLVCKALLISQEVTIFFKCFFLSFYYTYLYVAIKNLETSNCLRNCGMFEHKFVLWLLSLMTRYWFYLPLDTQVEWLPAGSVRKQWLRFVATVLDIRPYVVKHLTYTSVCVCNYTVSAGCPYFNICQPFSSANICSSLVPSKIHMNYTWWDKINIQSLTLILIYTTLPKLQSNIMFKTFFFKHVHKVVTTGQLDRPSDQQTDLIPGALWESGQGSFG